jgi:hypothetical protein
MRSSGTNGNIFIFLKFKSNGNLPVQNYLISSRSCLFARIPILMRANVTCVSFCPCKDLGKTLCRILYIFVRRVHSSYKETINQYLGCGTGSKRRVRYNPNRRFSMVWLVPVLADFPLSYFRGFLCVDLYFLSISFPLFKSIQTRIES